MSRRQRILVGPREIAGVASGLQFVLGERGHSVDVLLRWPHPFAYAVRPSRSRLLRLLGPAVAEREPGGKARRAISLAARVALLPYIAVRYDAVVYIGPDTLLGGGADRRLLTRLGVRTVTVYCGSEARPPYLDGWYAAAGSAVSLDDARVAVTRNRKRVQDAERDSSYVVNHAGGVQFHRAAFLDWTVVGFGQCPVARPAPAAANSTAGLRVLHAPSDPRMKGTYAIRRAIATLRDEGLAIDYVEVSGRTHDEVQQLLSSADLVIDQLYSDALLPGLATEAARAGTAVLVFGYAGDLIAEAARRTGAPTGHYAHPEQLLPRVRELLTDDARRSDLAQSLHAFVTSGHWSVAAIGERWEHILAGNPDPSWFSDPAEILYADGCAVSAPDLRAYLRSYVAAFGAGALEVGHHPGLETLLIDAAGD